MSRCLYCDKERTEVIDDYFCSQECSDKYDIAENYEQIENDEVICPYCKLSQNDIADGGVYYEADNDEIECQFCNKTFSLTASPYTMFTANATEEEIQKAYELEKSDKDE